MGVLALTRTGINLRANPNVKVIAVDPKVYSTRLKSVGGRLWYAVAGDTGGAIKGMKIDLHVPSKSEAYKFGKRKVKMKIID